MNKVIINIDGGSRGNPGPAAFGAVFTLSDGVVKTYSGFLGQATNNEAEYQALIFALKKAKALLGKDKIKKTPLEIRSDSELLVKQINGQYKILEPRIQQLFLEAWNLKLDFFDISVVSVPRTENKMADQAANEALDAQSVKRALF